MVRKPLMPVHGMRGSLRVFHHLRPTSLSRHFGFRRLNCPNPWRRFADTTHRHHVLPLTTVQTAVFPVADLRGVATGEHLAHQTIVIGGLITRMGVLKRLPVLSKDLLKDAPVP